VQENNLYDSRSALQRRLHSFAEELNIKLLREEFPELETRVEILQYEIGQRYVAIINRTSNGST
jgi:hypothetical protein